ncbi:unnamed protein product [Bursaphelenchus okinawaensis]|uniref:RING-type E3 ubiquitin transferase n=1 Tax=Bursaphelenchus okinawaensis TaxID=465554 RepID=A0A811JQ84_9BILA|nr:unnamed protein product [Bursaphelenchus okinawaensis]CAG9077410.1 unnamed protein product [Bursaphelenchus okinawaensis]
MAEVENRPQTTRPKTTKASSEDRPKTKKANSEDRPKTKAADSTDRPDTASGRPKTQASEGRPKTTGKENNKLGTSPRPPSRSPSSNKIYPTENPPPAETLSPSPVHDWLQSAEDPDAEAAVKIKASDIPLNTVPNHPAPDDVDIIFIEDVPAHLECKVCGQILRVPKKLPCEHMFCSDCLNSVTECPTCGAECDPKNITENKATTKEIQKLGVKCSYSENGCEWTGILKELKAHAIGCEYADTVCPRGCGKVYAKKDEEEHLKNCNKKMVECEFCGKEISTKGLKLHNKMCPLMIIDCPNRCGLLRKTREEINAHLPDCPKKGSVCPFGEFGCNYTGGRENLQKHIKDNLINHLGYLCDGATELQILLTQVHLNMDRTNRNVTVLQSRVDALEKLYGSQYIWRIDDYSKRLKDAKSNSKPVIYSPPFLSGRHGYKLMMSAALYGDGLASGKYLSVYLSILRGEHDPLLPWPFVHKVTFTMMDQNPEVNDREHMVYVIKPSPNGEDDNYLNRPKAERNSAFGAQKFCPIEDMQNYVREDVLFVRCYVDTENMIVL